MGRFSRFAWTVLAVVVAVIVWGAYVRATGSGAGCGSHWPTCNGEVFPRPKTIATWIEVSHRATSGLAFLLVAVQAVWAWRIAPAGHPVRRGATWSLALMVTEALVGAGLVLFRLVAHDASLARAAAIAVHLTNTFLLLASLSLTAWWASGGARPRWPRSREQQRLGGLFAASLLATIFVGAAGAVTALGDTLFRSTTLAEGLRQDVAPHAHFLLRLRALHPLLAVGLAAGLVLLAGYAHARRPAPTVRRFRVLLTSAVVLQTGLGLLNVALLAPTWMQLVHLLIADVVWVSLVLFSAAVMSETPVTFRAEEPAPWAQGA